MLVHARLQRMDHQKALKTAEKMNQYLIIPVFLVTFILVTPTSGWSKVSIRGKILNYDGKSIVYYHPTIEGIYTPYWIEVTPSGNGTFRIEYENEGYGNVRISYKGIGYRFFHDSDSKIYFEIKEKPEGARKRIAGERIFVVSDSIKQLMTVKIIGDYEEINRFYNENMRASFFTTQMVDGNYYSRLIYNASTPLAVMAIVDSLTRLEIDQINRLPWRLNMEDPDMQKKDAEIRAFLINEVHAFYGAIFLNGMFLKRKEHVIKLMTDSTTIPDIYNRKWEVLIEKMAAEMKENLKATPNSPDYIQFMESMAYTLSSYQQYDFPQDPTVTLDQMVFDRVFGYDTMLFRNERAQFAYALGGLQRFLNDQLFYSPALLHAYYDLQTKHPNSRNLAFYVPKIEELKTSLTASSTSFSEGKIIRKNYLFFNDLIQRFAGQNLLIDIWATWCHPCIEDFKYKDSISAFVGNGDLELLYISIDKPQWADRWKQSIRINKLAGNHFRADADFIADMWDVIGDYKGTIPRYVLIDKRGKIYKRTAARPGQGSLLVRQIESLVNSAQ